MLGEDPHPPSLQEYFAARDHAGDQAMLWLDLMSYLPDDILVKVDRMSMACSLEVRAPLLDHRLVEFMAKLPKKQKVVMGGSKRLLRRVARRYLPEAILNRPKQGFAVPLAAWLQRELRSWMEELLGSSACRGRGYFNAEHIQRMIAAHARGERDYSQQLWALMVLELWFQRHDGSA